MADALDALWGDVLQTEQLQGTIRAKATDLGLDPALALSLVHQESGFNPNAVSPTGVTGLAQVTIPTGQPYGQTPATRTDPNVSMHAGLSYLKDLLTQTGGNVQQALTRYNGGSDPHFAANVLQHYPLHAGPGQQGQGDEIDALAREIGLTKPGAPAPGVPELGMSTQVVPNVDPTQPATLAAASGAAPVNEEWGMDTQVIPNRDPTQPATLARPGGWANPGGPVPPSDLQIDIAKPSTDAPDAPRRQPENLDADIAKALEPSAFHPKQVAGMAIQAGATMGGAAVGGLTGPAAPFVAPITAALGSYGGHTLNKWLGFAPGTPTVLPQTFDDYLSLAVPMAAEAIPAAQTVLRYSRAGRAITAAEGETKTALEKYLVGFKADQAARQATFETARDAYNTDLSGAYAMRRAQVGAAESRADQLTQDALHAWDTGNSAQVTKGVQTAKVAQQEYYDGTAAYRTAEAGQRQAVAKVQSLVQPNGPYGPSVPAKTLYGKLADIAGDAPIPSAPAKQMIVDMTAEMADTGGLMPTTELAKIARTINALPETTDIAHLHELLKEVGPLTSVRNGAVRGTASRIMSGLHDTIEAGAKQGGIAEEASDLLYAARASYRQEKALQSLARIIDRRTAGSPITIDAENRLIVNPRTLLLKVEDTIAKEPLFKGSFKPAQLQGLRQDLTDLLHTPTIPKTRPMAPDAAPMPGLAPGQPRPTPVAPDVVRPVTVGPEPKIAPRTPFDPPAPVEPVLAPMKARLTTDVVQGLVLNAVIGHQGWKALAIPAAVVTADALRVGLAKALLSPTLRPLVLQSLSASGQVPKSLYGVLGALAAEKAQGPNEGQTIPLPAPPR
jgi:hypothetical protein